MKNKTIIKESVVSKLGFLYYTFIKNSVPPFYMETITNQLNKGCVIKLPKSDDSHKTIKGVHMVTNVPDYLSINLNIVGTQLKCSKISQYQGFLVNLKDFKDSQSYLKQQLSKRNIKNLYAKQRKLEGSHNISYTFHYGDITETQYDFLFTELYNMLEKRFYEKKIYNNNLLSWKYYYDLVYPMILNKKASLFVIYDGEKPITITLNFHLMSMVFSYIQSYDLNYSNYNMGDISMLKHIEWCKKNDFTIFDLSMGHTDYKIKWCNHTYRYKHHLFYNSSSITSRTKASVIILKFKLRQYLRDKDIIGKKFQLDKFFYKSKVKQLDSFNWKES
ncbi:MAG: GNAT family N-acetyltransferase [Arenibacter latericius]|nr:GNAT family N-acetyltransferase [Arenibacter latericius]